MARIYKYLEGTTSADTVLKDLTKIMCTAVRTKEIKEGGKVIKNPEVIINRNWDVVYPKADKFSEDLRDIMDWSRLTPEEFVKKVIHQTGKITDTVILKTTTTKKKIEENNQTDTLIGIEDELNVDSIDMYVELYKPKYLIDTEQYPADCERSGVTPYVKTKDIYKEYLKTEEEQTIDLIHLCKSLGISGFSKKIETESSTSSTHTQIDLIKSFLKSNNCPNTITRQKMEELKQKTNIPESLLITFNALQFKTNLEYNIEIKFIDKYSYNGSYDYTYCEVTTKRDFEIYTFSSGMTIPIPNSNNIFIDTAKVIKENNGIQSPIGSFSIDKSTKKIIVNSNFSITPDKDGTLSLIAVYKKDGNQNELGSKVLPNNHHIFIRMFDKLNPEGNGPIPVTYDEYGNATNISNTSVFSKMSWYQDFEEVLLDELDDTPGESDVTKGIANLPVETPGLNGGTKFQFFINTNNDRTLLTLVGNPSLDFADNRSLISNCYIGQIESFKNSINDTAGNFALYTSSSTIPCMSSLLKTSISLNDKMTVGIGDGVTNRYPCSLPQDRKFDKQAKHTATITDATSGSVTTLTIGNGFSLQYDSTNPNKAEIAFLSGTPLGSTIELQYFYKEEKIKTVSGVTRDMMGNVILTQYPETYGLNTATGVIDVSMLHTRSKAYFQRHAFLFGTTEEYMSKKMYGKSAYTGEYYADKIKIVHGIDGQRGMLQDMLVLDRSSLGPNDELVVNKDFKDSLRDPEETYVFFPVTTSYSPFSSSPNATYGIAIKKEVKEPKPEDDKEAVDRAFEDIDLVVGNLYNLTSDIYLPTELGNEVKVTWTSSNEKAITFK